jgi:hypothetical protein
MTPELTQDFHERTSLNGYRFGFAVIGTLIGAGGALPLVAAFGSKTTGYTVMGALFGAVMLVTALITFYTVKEPAAPSRPPTRGFFKTYLKVFKNKPYMLILAAYSLHVTALTVVSGIAIYYFKYIHGSEPQTTIAISLFDFIYLFKDGNFIRRQVEIKALQNRSNLLVSSEDNLPAIGIEHCLGPHPAREIEPYGQAALVRGAVIRHCGRVIVDIGPIADLKGRLVATQGNQVFVKIEQRIRIIGLAGNVDRLKARIDGQPGFNP